MALTAAQLQARIDALQAARDSGVLRVRHGNDQTDFQSVADMNKTLQNLKAQLDTLNGTVKPRLNYIEQTSKGFGHWHGFTDWDDDDDDSTG